MKKIFLTMLAVMSTSAAAAQYAVVSDNSAAIAKYERDHKAAQKYLDDIKALMDRNTAILLEAQGDRRSPKVYQHTKEIKKMAKPAGWFGQPFVDPLQVCEGVGTLADLTWSSLRENSSDGLRVYGDLDNYHKAVRDCESALREPPEKTVLVKVPTGQKPPFEGCGKIYNLGDTPPKNETEWSCPASSLPKQ